METTKETPDDGDGGEREHQKRKETMITMSAETWEDRRGRIGRENVDGVPHGRTATAAPMAPTPSLAEERPTKKRPAQRIGQRIAEAATVSSPAVSDTVFQRRTAAAATAGSRNGEGQKVGISTKRK